MGESEGKNGLRNSLINNFSRDLLGFGLVAWAVEFLIRNALNTNLLQIAGIIAWTGLAGWL